MIELLRILLGFYAEVSVKRIDARLVLAERGVAPAATGADVPSDDAHAGSVTEFGGAPAGASCACPRDLLDS